MRHITRYEALSAQLERYDPADCEQFETINRLSLLVDRECKLMMALTVNALKHSATRQNGLSVLVMPSRDELFEVLLCVHFRLNR